MSAKKMGINKKGYTLTEMLVAVAILIIISAIAIPAIGGLRKNLQLTKYDDVARQIFLVSQNKLTTMKSAGTLDNFLKEVEDHYSGQQLGGLNQQPQDYDGETDAWKKLYYFKNTDAVLTNYIIGTDSVLVASLENDGHFLVELNPETGDVYGVFYAEKAFTYEDINMLLSRNKSDRKDKMIGYYGGISELSASSNLPTEFTPTVKFVNKEDLYLDIECSGMRKLIKTQDKIALSITLTDESSTPTDVTNHVYTFDLRGGTDFWISNDKVKIQVLLDSIRGGAESFQNITQGKLTRGDNITAIISMTYTNEGVTITGSSASPTTNSLFAEKDKNGNLSVAYVRHLNNLRASNYTFTGTNKISINQTAPIDYDFNNWDADAMIREKAGQTPYSGTFSPIDNAGLFDELIFNGNNNELLNFDISGTDNVGFFKTLNNCTLENIKLVNFKVLGNRFVGALAGQVQGGSITNCGVYLETRDEYNRPLTDMAARVEKYNVTGSSYVGGLVGAISGSTITKGSFAAINVNGYANVGGFCGQYRGGFISNSYASGEINGKQDKNGNFIYASCDSAGGFAGTTSYTSINESYATSDVIAYVRGGGFIGNATGGSVANSSSYGLVRRGDNTLDKSTSGGFVGRATGSFSNCKFLRQANYNYDYTSSISGVLPKGFPDLKVTGNLADNCRPYSDELVGNQIPFKMVTTEDGTVIPHYGNWPAELKLQTSLVYYEKYATADSEGNYYGYYAETSLTAEGESLDTGEVNSWKVNTLRKQPCVEDGYALMTIYALSKFEYRLNDDLKPSTETITVYTDTTPGVNKAVKITDKVSLQFTNTVDSSKYTISNAKVYQLPFSLQMTDRNTAARFYDRVTMTGYVDSQIKFENYTFFYCPDFAKNAINPDISKTAAATPKNPTGEDRPISIRSPRHINALARAAYYWNTTKWTDSGDTRYYFQQQNDIDFGLYTKKYCGVTYNLMDTSQGNAYRNRPIGRPNSQAFTDPNGETYTPSNFRNSYDGQGYEIIDYRCITTKADEYQFTGLFGEVQQAVLKNIVMVASDPENNSGYVISKYNDGSKHAGVGALVGLIYVDSGSEYNDSTYSSVTNCSVSGYTVSYSPDSSANQPSAIGGLVGYNFGKIENSSAVNKLVTAENSENKNRYMGGLVGSINGKGSISNCYAGGVVTASQVGTGTTYLAGICGGFDDIYGAYYTDGQKGNRNQSIGNVYSYCTWENGGVYGRPYAVINKQDKMTLTNAYYLTNTVENGVTLYGTDIASARNFAQLSVISFGSSGSANSSGRATKQNTHPWSESLNSVAYSYPAMVTNPRAETEVYVHYGDWYYESTLKDSGYLTYYELYSDGTYACSFINGKKGLASVGIMDTTNSKNITQAGYGILRLAEDAGIFKVDDTVLTLGTVLASNISVNKGVYNLYDLSEASQNLLLPDDKAKSKEISFVYEETEDSARNPVVRIIHINAAYANAISTTALEASSLSPLKVRTPQQLQNMSGADVGWYILLDHDITANGQTGNILNSGYTFNGGYASGGSERVYNGYKTGSNGNHIFGLSQPLFSTVAQNGTINNLALIGVNMNSSSAKQAAVALNNFGTIQNSFATGTITTTATVLGSAGLVLENNGTISNSYTNVKISNSRGDVAAFVLRNTGNISDCYAVGGASSSSSSASGFIGETSSGSSVQNCYTISTVVGASSYGFAPSGSAGVNTSNCYWAKDRNVNNSISNSAGTSRKLSQMKTVFTSGSWTISNAGATWGDTLSGIYPYPRISAMDHCGDWPLATGGGKIGAVKIYRKNNGSGRGYYGNGLAVDVDSLAQTRFNSSGNAETSNGYTRYAVVFDNDIAENLSNWEAEYSYWYYDWGWKLRTETLTLSTNSDYSLVNSNATNFTVNAFWVYERYYNLDNVTLRSKVDGTSYVLDFDESSNTFYLR